MSYSIHIEPYHRGHLDPLFKLLRSYFREGDRLLTPEYAEWLYARNPFGPALMISAAFAGEWAAFLAFIPVGFRRETETLPGYFAVNALVHPQHQGKRLFARMIEAGRGHIADQAAAFVGHPNNQAMGTWSKTDVHFQEVLRAFAAQPVWPRDGLRARRIRSSEDLPDISILLEAQAKERTHWKVDASSSYLRWRYLEHPTSAYHVQLLERTGQPVGIQVARRMLPGVHLMMDQFIADADLPAATALLPPFTACFVSDHAVKDMGGALLRIPLRKQIRYFFTAVPPIAAGQARHLALSASDF